MKFKLDENIPLEVYEFPAILGGNTVRFFSRCHSFRMTLRNPLAVILSEAKNLKPL